MWTTGIRIAPYTYTYHEDTFFTYLFAVKLYYSFVFFFYVSGDVLLEFMCCAMMHMTFVVYFCTV